MERPPWWKASFASWAEKRAAELCEHGLLGEHLASEVDHVSAALREAETRGWSRGMEYAACLCDTMQRIPPHVEGYDEALAEMAERLRRESDAESEDDSMTESSGGRR